MKILADLHISPRTVQHLRNLGHDVIRVTDVLPGNAADALIVEEARRQGRVVLTQDLGFARLIALSVQPGPSVISLRLTSANVDLVNATLERLLPGTEVDLDAGALVTIEDDRTRTRQLPIR